jgi:hypothetical protein
MIRIFLQGILREAEILEEIENGFRRFRMIRMERNTLKKRMADLAVNCLCLISKVLEVIRADLPRLAETKTRSSLNFTAQECRYIVIICPNKCYKYKFRCVWVYGGLLPILGADAKRA